MLSLKKIRKNRERILGLNERYLEYIRPHNLRKAFHIADDKILTKKILMSNEIPVPKMIGTINSHEEVDNFDFESLPNSFVIKPVHGSKGGGVEIFYNRDKDGKWIKGDGQRVSHFTIQAMCRDIVDGRYSLHNEPDIVLIEDRIKPHKVFRYHTFKGSPDIRVIVFNKMPIMSELRLPTEKSRGTANMSAGAIGAGVDIAVGKTTTANLGMSSDLLEHVPHTKVKVSGLRIPYWNRILEYSVNAAEITGLGYAGVDFLIDRERGPVIVEVNARSGLGIQLANNTGLRSRLKKAGDINVKSLKHGIRVAKDMFGGEIEEGIESMSGKEVIGLIEKAVVYYKGNVNETKTVRAKIDTGASITSLDEGLAREIGFAEALDYAQTILNKIPARFTEVSEVKRFSKENNLNQRLEEHPDIVGTAIIKQSSGITYRITVEVDIEISDTKFTSRANIIDRSGLTYMVLIGSRDLRRFLIDPTKKYLNGKLSK